MLFFTLSDNYSNIKAVYFRGQSDSVDKNQDFFKIEKLDLFDLKRIYLVLMAAPFYISFTRWQHNIMFQSTVGSTILWVNPHISITRWQHNIIIFQSPDGSKILFFDQQMAAQYYLIHSNL